MAATSKGAVRKNAKAPKRTVASLAKEIAEVRAEIGALRAQAIALRDQLNGAVAVSQATVPASPAAATAASVASAIASSTAASKASPAADARASMLEQVRAFIAEVFELALVPMPDDEDDKEALLLRFLDTIHSSRRGTTMLDQNNLSYVWDPIRQRPGIYLNDEQAPGSFVVTRMQPSEITASTERVKVFLKARSRMPTPITLRREAQADGAWRIEASSL